MARLKTIILEIHRRSLWQVLAVYVAASWVIFEVIQTLTEGLGLPNWFPALALVVLLVGLPIVLGTAFVQEGGPALGRADPTLLPAGETTARGPADRGLGGEAGGLRRLLTWRNAVIGGVLAFALWGVVAAGWIVLGSPGLFIVKAEAADFFSERDRVVIAELENRTDQDALGLAIREAIVTDLDQSEYVNVVARSELNEVLDRMRLPDTATVSEEIAIEIARRLGYPAVVSGSVAPLGAGYQLTARIIETGTGEVAVRLRETADDDTEVVAAVERLARLVRRHLGESLGSLRRSRRLPDVTTASLEALELFARGRQHLRLGDRESAIPLLRQAISVDTAFASAHRALAVAYGNVGNLAAAQTSVDQAYHHAKRLVDKERFLTGALYHSYRNRLDSAAYYYRLIIDRYPSEHVALNNLGDVYERMGRYEDALLFYRRASEADPNSATTYLNVASGARTLGRPGAADSALAVMQERFPGSLFTQGTAIWNAFYADDFARADSLASDLARDATRANAAWGVALNTAAAALHGEMNRAFELADATIELASEANTALLIYISLLTVEHAALTAGTPDRVRPYLEVAREHANQETGPFIKHLALGFIANGYALAGDLPEARSILAQMDSLSDAEEFHASGIGEQARAVIALQENRAEESLEHLRRARRADYDWQNVGGRLLLADAYAALGQLEEAAAHYDSLTSSYRLDFRDRETYAAVRPLAHERLGTLYLTLGDTAAALKHLAQFVELWQKADPELQPRVESARRLMAQLAGER